MDSRIKLLIVDRDARFLNTLTRSLNPRDFNLSLASDAPGEVAGWQGFDLALVNPDACGLPRGELLRQVRAAHPTLELVLLADQAPLEPPAADSGSVLPKPVEMLTLLRALRQAYQRRVQRKHALSADELRALLSPAAGESSQSLLRKLRALDTVLGDQKARELGSELRAP